MRLLRLFEEKVFLASSLDEDGRVSTPIGLIKANTEMEARKKLAKTYGRDAYTGFVTMEEAEPSEIQKMKNELKKEIQIKVKRLKALEKAQ